MPAIGELRHRVVLQEEVVSPDGAGGQVRSWRDIVSLWASIEAVQGGEHLERCASLGVVAFDKTGTLTRGKPVVTDVVSRDGDTGTILRAAASVEHFSEHPLARAIVDTAAPRGYAVGDVEDFASVTGFGVEATVSGRRVLVGRAELLAERGVPAGDVAAAVERLQAAGRTVAVVAVDGAPIGA